MNVYLNETYESQIRITLNFVTSQRAVSKHCVTTSPREVSVNSIVDILCLTSVKYAL